MDESDEVWKEVLRPTHTVKNHFVTIPCQTMCFIHKYFFTIAKFYNDDNEIHYCWHCNLKMVININLK
jgi:hypothetical protein